MCAAASSFRLSVSSAYSGRAGEWPQSPSEERTSESAVQPCATHRVRLTIQLATAREAFSPQGEWLDRRMSNQRFEKQRQFLQNRFASECYAGLHFTIGVQVFLLAVSRLRAV